MAKLHAVIEAKARAAVHVISPHRSVVRAYVFGSQADGHHQHWSDIDLAVVVEGMESRSLHDRARLSVQVQREAGDEVEIHLLPARAPREPDPASFAASVTAHGVEVA